MLATVLIVVGVVALWAAAFNVGHPRISMLGLGLALICTGQYILPMLAK